MKSEGPERGVEVAKEGVEGEKDRIGGVEDGSSGMESIDGGGVDGAVDRGGRRNKRFNGVRFPEEIRQLESSTFSTDSPFELAETNHLAFDHPFVIRSTFETGYRAEYSHSEERVRETSTEGRGWGGKR